MLVLKNLQIREKKAKRKTLNLLRNQRNITSRQSDICIWSKIYYFLLEKLERWKDGKNEEKRKRRENHIVSIINAEIATDSEHEES